MKRFPIDLRVSNRYSKFQLNNEWTIECDWSVEGELYLSVSIKTRKKIISAEIPVFGVLDASYIDGQLLKHSEFSKFITSSPGARLVQLSVASKLFRHNYYKSEFCRLHGFIIIASEKCENCNQTKSLVQLSNDFERLLDPQISCFADVNLICGDVSIPAHKVILSARSPVFAAMFKNPMKEKRENRVDITDIDASVLRTMMMYIYTGIVSDLTIVTATDLLIAADKYMIQDLKDVCCDYLKNNVTLQHVLTTLVSGGDCLAECLKSIAKDYISNKCADFSLIENTEEWNTIKKESPALGMEILESFVKSRDQK